jgi:hypothetical protein
LGVIAVERPDGFKAEGQLSGTDVERIQAIVDEPTFRRDIAAPTPACPPAVDLGATLVLTTTEVEYTDRQAGGCLISDAFQDHPYRRLRNLLEGLVMTYLPAVNL